MRIMNRNISRRTLILSLCVLGLLSAGLFAALAWDSRPIAQIIETLKLAPGQRVADLGAGDGVFTYPLADKVGSEGIVFAIEIEQKKLNKIENNARKHNLKNVCAVLAAEDDPRLPEPVDLILIVHTLHHISGRADYLRGLRRHLKPAGRVAIIDFTDHWPLFHGKMKYSLPELDGWMQAAGFKQTERHDFVPHNFFVIYQISE